MKFGIAILVALVVFLSLSDSIAESLKLGKLCRSEEKNDVRGSDDWGEGRYGAPRKGGKTKTHLGVDIVCKPGSKVLAPFSGTIEKTAYPYDKTDFEYGDKVFNDGLLITSDDGKFQAKIFYFTPDKTSGSFDTGSILGTSRSISGAYPEITEHLHLQLYEYGIIVDPTSYL